MKYLEGIYRLIVPYLQDKAKIFPGREMAGYCRTDFKNGESKSITERLILK